MTGTDSGPGPGPDPRESPLFVNAVEKAMRVLAAFDGRRERMSLTEIARRAGVGVSAAQRHVHTLAALGYLVPRGEPPRYEISPRLLSFAHHYLSSSELVARAEPWVRQLAAATEETVNLTVPDGPDVVFVLRYVSRHTRFPDLVVGSRMPAYCTAPGLAMLSCLPPDRAMAVLGRDALVAHTAHTVTAPAAIAERLRRVRAAGYAHTREEYRIGDMVVAAAVTDGDGRPVAAVSIAVAKERFDPAADEDRLARLVISAAAAISAPARPTLFSQDSEIP